MKVDSITNKSVEANVANESDLVSEPQIIIVTPPEPSSKPQAKINFDALEDMGYMMDMDLTVDDNDPDELDSSENILKGSKSSFIRSSAQSNIFDIFDDETEELNLKNMHSVLIKDLQRTESLSLINANFTKFAKESICKLSVQDTQNALISLLFEREDYKERLKMAKSAIICFEDRLEKLKQLSTDVPLNMSESRIHLAFLFSSPLVRKSNSKIQSVMQLDYLSEINDILKV